MVANVISSPTTEKPGAAARSFGSARYSF